MFFERLQADHEGHRPKVDAINGGYLQLNETHPGKYHMEANLDVQYTMALTSPHEVTNVRVRSRSSIGNLNCMLAAFDQYYCDQRQVQHRGEGIPGRRGQGGHLPVRSQGAYAGDNARNLGVKPRVCLDRDPDQQREDVRR